MRDNLCGNVESGFTQVVAAVAIVFVIVTSPIWGLLWFLDCLENRQEKLK